MNYYQLRAAFHDQICFTSNQVYAWHPDFDKNNLSRWIKKGHLVKLRNGYYLFSEHLNLPNVHLYIANRIYRPSYISLHTALAFYGLIPEAITPTTSVSTLKTARFRNAVGYFSYKNVKEQLFFGINQVPFSEGKCIWLATPEKSITDLLYLYPFYNNPGELSALRLDEETLSELLNPEVIHNYLQQIKSGALEKRVRLLLRIYL